MFFVLRTLNQTLGNMLAALQPVCRFLGWLLLLLATIASVIDATRWQLELPGQTSTPLAKYLSDWVPGSIVATQQFIETRMSPVLWDPIMTGFLDLTPWISFTVLGLVLMWLGQRGDRVSVFVN